MRRSRMRVRAQRVKIKTPFHHEMRPTKLGVKGGMVSMSGKKRKEPLIKWKPVHSEKSGSIFDNLKLGERMTIERHGRRLTYERVHAFGRGKGLKVKLVENEKV